MTLPIDLERLSGKAAVWVRGFIEHASSQTGPGDVKLRPAQKAGMDAVEELGETISIPYISKLTKQLETSGVVIKARKGKGYVITSGENFNQVAEHLFDTAWGSTIEKEATEDDIRMRSAIIDHMNDTDHIRIEAENPIDKRAYQVLIDKFKAGQYDMVFVHRTVALFDEVDGNRVRTLNESVANR